MKTNITVCLFTVGDQGLQTGGNVFNRHILNTLTDNGYETSIIVLPDSASYDPKVSERLVMDHCSQLKPPGILLFDSLVLGYLGGILPRLYRTHIIIALMHLPQFMHPDISAEQSAYRQDMERNALSAVHQIICTSAYTHEVLRNSFQHLPDTAVITPGVRVNTIKSTYMRLPQHLITIANPLPSKGYPFLLKVLAGISHIPWSMQCIGDLTMDPDHSGWIQQLVLHYDLNGRIEFTGALKHEHVGRLLSGADLMVFSTEFETYGMVIAESIAHGVPVIASDLPGTRLAFQKGCGRLLPVGDEFQWSEALQEVLTKEEKYAQMIQQVSKHRKGFRTWEEAGRECDDLFRSLLSLQRSS